MTHVHGSRPPGRRGRAGLLATALAAVLALGACGGTDGTTGDSADPTDTPTSDAPSPSPTDTASSAPTDPSDPTSTPASPSPTATEPPASGTTLAEALLPAAELPGFNDRFTWRDGTTSKREPDDLATCHRFPVSSIGAFRTLTRTYLPPQGTPRSDASATELVARFADAETARKATSVLSAWRDRCGPRIRSFDLHRLGGLQQVDAGDDAAWYLLTLGPLPDDPDAATFEATGWVRSGERVAVLDLRVAGQDYNYPPGEEPMVEALRRAAARLG